MSYRRKSQLLRIWPVFLWPRARGDALIIFDFNFWPLTSRRIARARSVLQKELRDSEFHPGSFVTGRASVRGRAGVFAVLFLQLKLTTGTLPN